jgi:DNA-binding CsgD family transcriptional regulator
MNHFRNREKRLLEILDVIYAAADDDEMMHAVFMALRHLMVFPSGIFMPVDPDTLELRQGLCFDCAAADMAIYLSHYAPLDPYVLRQPSLVLLNQTMRLSDVAGAGELERSEFCEFMQRVPYYHALGILTGLAEQPVGVFSVHRQRHQRDFSDAERAIIDHIGPHLARASVLRRQASEPEQRAETGLVVLGRGGEPLYLNATARRFLGLTPPAALLMALQGRGVVSMACQHYRVSRVPWVAASLLWRFVVAEAAADLLDHRQSDPVARWSAATREGTQAIIIALQPFRQRMDVIRRLSHYSLSPRQTEVALCAQRGLANAEIARQLYIGVQTVKDHLQEIYEHMGVKTRAELLIKLLGTDSHTSRTQAGVIRAGAMPQPRGLL